MAAQASQATPHPGERGPVQRAMPLTRHESRSSAGQASPYQFLRNGTQRAQRRRRRHNLNFLNDAPEQRRSQALAPCEGTSNCKPSKQRGKQYARRNSKLNNQDFTDCCVEGGANARRDSAPMRNSTPPLAGRRRNGGTVEEPLVQGSTTCVTNKLSTDNTSCMLRP